IVSCELSTGCSFPRIRNSQFAILNLLLTVGLLLPATLAAQTPSADQQRTSDLAKMRSRISALKSKLSESEKNVATLSEELKRLDLKLEIAQKEAELVAATREEFTRQLAARRAKGAGFRGGLAAAVARPGRAGEGAAPVREVRVFPCAPRVPGCPRLSAGNGAAGRARAPGREAACPVPGGRGPRGRGRG